MATCPFRSNRNERCRTILCRSRGIESFLIVNDSSEERQSGWTSRVCPRLLSTGEWLSRPAQSFIASETHPRSRLPVHYYVYNSFQRDSKTSCTPSFATCLAKVLSNETASGAAFRDPRTNNLAEHCNDLKKRSRAGLRKKLQASCPKPKRSKNEDFVSTFQSTPSPAQHQAPSNSLQKKRLKTLPNHA
jgi:hypothetical protein